MTPAQLAAGSAAAKSYTDNNYRLGLTVAQCDQISQAVANATDPRTQTPAQAVAALGFVSDDQAQPVVDVVTAAFASTPPGR